MLNGTDSKHATKIASSIFFLALESTPILHYKSCLTGIQKTEDVVISADFPPELVCKYKELNDVYVAQTPIKAEEATLIHKIMAMDLRFLYGSGLQWNQEPEPQPASGRNEARHGAETIEMDESQDRDADTEDESHVATIDKAGTRSRGKSRFPHC